MDIFSSLKGAVSRPELLAAGLNDHEVRAALRSKRLVKLGNGIVIPAEMLDGTPETRHRQRALAVARKSAGESRALGGSAAATVLGLPVWGLDVTRVVFVENGAKKARTRATGAVRVEMDRRPPAITDVDGVRVVSAARVVVDLARTAERIPAIAVGDAALHLDLCTADELANELDLITGMAGAARARRVVAELNGDAESVLESRSRITFVDEGLPVPELQVDLYDAWGNWVARVDFLWRKHGLVGECDGKKKYSGQDGRGRLLYEKYRSDAIAELEYQQVHWGWCDLEDLDDKARLIKRLRRKLGLDKDPTNGQGPSEVPKVPDEK